MVLSPRVGLLGAGDAAGHHARALRALHADATARWAGVCARDPARVDAFCEAHGAPPDAPRATDLDAFLDPALLDAVVIATPDGLHAAHATLAAARGLHVLVEKPVALDAASARAVAATCRAAGVRLAVGYHLRHHAGHRALRDNLGPLIGSLRHVDLRWAWPDPARDGWRARRRDARWWALAALGTHALDLARWFAGGGPAVMRGASLRIAGGVDLAGDAIVALGEEVTAHAWVSVEQRATARVLLAGLDGELECVGTLGARGAGAITLRRGAGERVAVPFEAVDPYEAQLRAFVAAVVEGRDPEASGDDGAANVALLEAWSDLARGV